MHIGPEGPTVVRIDGVIRGLWACDDVGVVLLDQSVAKAPREIPGHAVRPIVAPNDAQAALHRERPCSRRIAEAMDIVRRFELQILAHAVFLEDVGIEGIQSRG